MAELLVGVELLPIGRRRDGLETALAAIVLKLFDDRILPFDARAAVFYASSLGKARSAGKALAVADGPIAAIALTHGFAVATRDRAPFIAAGVSVIDPWTS